MARAGLFSYVLTVHSSQGLTIADPQKVCNIDEYLNQLERVVCSLGDGFGVACGEPAEVSAQQLCIHRKVVAFKLHDAAKGL